MYQIGLPNAVLSDATQLRILRLIAQSLEKPYRQYRHVISHALLQLDLSIGLKLGEPRSCPREPRWPMGSVAFCGCAVGVLDSP
jgi:hypothetical protein